MINFLLNKLLSIASTTKQGNKLNVLTYHRVLRDFTSERNKELSLKQFKQQMLWLKKHFNVLPLEKALAHIEANTLPERAISITVDDGYEDSYYEIFDVLKSLGLQATFFITTSGLDEGVLWDEKLALALYHAPLDLKAITLNTIEYDISTFENKETSIELLAEQVKYLPLEQRNQQLLDIFNQTTFHHIPNNFLTPEQIQEMYQAGMEIGAHTHRHPILACETQEDARDEITMSKQVLEEIIQNEVKYFAYPNGKIEKDFTIEHAKMIESIGFKAAFSTNWGTLKDLGKDRFIIKRFTPWDLSKYKFCLRLMMNYWKGYEY